MSEAFDRTPLRCPGSSRRTHDLQELPDGGLRLRLRASSRLLPWVMLTLTAPAALYVAFGPFSPPSVTFYLLLFIAVICGGNGLVFLFLARPELRFDPSAGTVTLARFARRRVIPLGEIRAVQFVQGGWHRRPGETGGMYHTYQLNLVLPDGRVNVSNHTDWAATYRSGERLAEVLGVPVDDGVSA